MLMPINTQKADVVAYWKTVFSTEFIKNRWPKSKHDVEIYGKHEQFVKFTE